MGGDSSKQQLPERQLGIDYISNSVEIRLVIGDERCDGRTHRGHPDVAAALRALGF